MRRGIDTGTRIQVRIYRHAYTGTQIQVRIRTHRIGNQRYTKNRPTKVHTKSADESTHQKCRRKYTPKLPTEVHTEIADESTQLFRDDRYKTPKSIS